MFNSFAKYKQDIPKLLFQSEFKQILNNQIESISSLHYPLHLLKSGKILEQCAAAICLLLNLSKSFVYTVK